MSLVIHMKDELFRELRAKVASMKDAHVKVGVLQANGSTMHEDGETTLAELLAIHEFGAPKAGIPARAPLKRTFIEDEGKNALGKFLTRVGTMVVKDRVSVRDGLEQLGSWAVGRIKLRIKQHLPPPLKPETVQRKLGKHGAGGTTPLIATSQLINALTWEVKDA